MFISELAEPQLLVIYPGRFQPFHKGHHAVYEWLATKFGRNNVFIATSNKTDNEKSPFSFSEKAYFMQLTGVPGDRIVQSTQPYNIQNVLASGQIPVANPANTVVIFAVSEKDMTEDPRFSFAPKKDGTPPYFQPLKDINQTENMDQHGYILTVPTFQFSVLGKPMQSASELRAQYKAADEKTRQAIVGDLFGKYTQEAEQIMNSKLSSTSAAAPPASKPNKSPKMPKAAGELAESRTKNDIITELAQLRDEIIALKDRVRNNKISEEAAGVGQIATAKQKNDPRYKTSLTVDVQPDTPAKNMKAMHLIKGGK